MCAWRACFVPYLACRYGPEAMKRVKAALQKHISQGTVEMYGPNQDQVRLSDPQGLLMSNDIISDTFVALSDFERGVAGQEEGTGPTPLLG